MKYHRHSILKKHIINIVSVCNYKIKGGQFKAKNQDVANLVYFYCHKRNERIIKASLFLFLAFILRLSLVFA